jgi:uncharacterized RDD family membrane protein YckC
LLDTARRIPTPEGIELTLRLAGPVPRAFAWVIDFLLRAAVLWLLLMVSAAFANLGTAVFLLAYFFLEWLFPAWCEVRWGGATPGKKALGLVVLNDDGSPVAWPAALTRNLLRVVDFLPLLYAVGFLSTVINRDFKRLGDLAAGTVVAYRDRAHKGFTIAAAPPLAPPVPLSLAEQRAILDFAERAPGLTDERQSELASLATAVAGAPTGAAERLLRIANHLLGRR